MIHGSKLEYKHKETYSTQRPVPGTKEYYIHVVEEYLKLEIFTYCITGDYLNGFMFCGIAIACQGVGS